MDLEGTIHFILDTLARIEVSTQKNSEQIERRDAQIGQLSELVGRVAQAALRLVDRINDLRDAQATTDYKLHTLVDTVDKLGRRNGGASKL